MWNRHNMSFIAVTVHCSSPDTLETNSYFLCCKYFPGHHTKLAVAQKLQNIFVKYDILNKVYFITSDQAGEYVYGIFQYGNKFLSMEELRRTLPIDIDYELENEEIDPLNEVLEDEIPLPLPNDDNALDFNFVSHDALANVNENATEHVQQGEDDANQRNIPLLPNLNRISCSSHMFDKVSAIVIIIT